MAFRERDARSMSSSLVISPIFSLSDMYRP
jgi:hypothetical protein